MSMTLDKRLSPCPICGAKAFVSHDVVDGFEFGWSVGCPRACIADGVHGLNDPESFERARITMFYLPSKEKAIEEWNKRRRDEYELAIEQMEHDAMYEQTYNSEDGSM